MTRWEWQASATVSVSIACNWSGGICVFGDISVTVSSFVDLARVLFSFCCVFVFAWLEGNVTCTGVFVFCRRGVYRVEASRGFLTGRSRAVGSLTSSSCLCNAGDSPLDRKRRINSGCSECVEVYIVTRLVCVVVTVHFCVFSPSSCLCDSHSVSKPQRVS